MNTAPHFDTMKTEHTAGVWQCINPREHNRACALLSFFGVPYKSTQSLLCIEALEPSPQTLRASNKELREALEELTGWVDRAIVPTFNRRKPMPENGRKTMEQARAALNNTKP